MIGHIYINNQIGNSYNDNGEITVKGVELQDVVMQVESNKDALQLVIHINSQGGNVRVGKIIADYISKLPNAITIAERYCASMGTEIHLARPIHQRKIEAGCEYLIHCPLIDGISGNADELQEAADWIRQTEDSMLSMYHKATGLDKSALSGLMKQETSLTPEQCISLGFASEIVHPLELKAVAFIDKSKLIKNQNKEEMNLKERIAKAMAVLTETETEVKAMTVATDNGALSFESEGELPAIGEAVMLEDGNVAPDGTYTTESGVQIVVVEGIVAEIIEAAVEDVEALKQENESLKSQLAELSAKVETIEADAVKQVEEAVIAAKAQIKSNFEPKAEKPQFRQEPKELSMREKAELRKKELETKKNK